MVSGPDRDRPAGPGSDPDEPNRVVRIHRWIVIAVVAVMAADLGWLVYNGQWPSVFPVLALIGIILSPTLLRDRLPVRIPEEFQILALLFTFAALFLGEMRSYYARIWWWDIALHASSGLLLGILGFLLIYVLNESRRVDLHLRPRFVALFAFLFAVAVGALWEVFEFSMDSLFGTNMQKPMLGDPSGLTDTMWDLIVDALGGLAISAYGRYYLRHPEQSFIDRWIQKFIARNPAMFRR